MRKVISAGILLTALALAAQESVVRRAVSGGASSSPQNYNAGFPHVRAKLQTNGPLTVLLLGDSLLTGFADIPLVTWLQQSYGFAGGWGTGGSGSPIYNRTNSPGTIELNGATRDVTKSPGSCWTLLPGSNVTFQVFGVPSCSANVIAVDYIAENGAGGIMVQTNVGNTVWGNLEGINANNAGTATGVSRRWTNATSTPLQLRVVCTNGAVTLFSGGLFDYSLRGGIVYSTLATGGSDLSDFTSCPTNITGPILKGLAPDLVIWHSVDGERNGTNVWSSYAPAFSTFCRNYFTNADIFLISTPPQETLDDTYVTQDTVEYSTALANRWSFYYLRGLFGGSSNALYYGFMLLSDPHETTLGAQVLVDSIAQWAQLINVGPSFKGQARFYVPGNTLPVATTNYALSVFRPDGTRGLTLTHNTIDPGANSAVYIGNAGVNNSGKLVMGSEPNTFTPAQMLSWAGDAISSYLSASQPGNLIVGQSGPDPGANFLFQNGTNYYWANHTIYEQVNDGSVTNVSTSTNSLFATGVGSLNLPSSLWKVGRSITIRMDGLIWTPAVPGNTLFGINLAVGAVPNTIATNLFALTASLVADPFSVEVVLTCRTNSAIGFIKAQGKVYVPSAVAGTSLVFKEFKSTDLIFDTTAASSLSLFSTNGATTVGIVSKTAIVTMK